MPAVTVLMAVWNAEAHLAAAVQSVLAQSFRDFEFLIIDDASTDATPNILQSFTDERIRTVRATSNVGLTASLNHGLQLARNELIARQDGDDLWHPHRLALQHDFLARHTDVGVVGSQVSLIDERGRGLGRKHFPLTHRAIEWMALFDNPLAHSAVMFRRAVVQEAGGYDERFPASQDYDLWTRLSARTHLANLPERLVALRIRENSVTRTHRHPELIRRIQQQHHTRLFPDLPVSEEDLDLMGRFRTVIEPAKLARFHEWFQGRLVRFQTERPETKHCRDFRRMLSLQFERIGYNLLTVSRGAAWKEFGRALKTYPAALWLLPWGRIFALTLGGEGARSLYRKLAPEKAAP